MKSIITKRRKNTKTPEEGIGETPQRASARRLNSPPAESEVFFRSGLLT
jgi:hypothetical protein